MGPNLYTLASRTEAVLAVADTDCGFARSARALSSRSWFRLGPGLPEIGARKLSPVFAPGVIGMAVLFSSIFNGIALLWDRQFGFLKETLVAPVPRINIMIGRTLGGATVGDVPGDTGSFGMPHRGIPPRESCNPAAGLRFHGSDRSCVRRSWGRQSSPSSKDMQGFQLIMNFLVIPIFFLSGALFSAYQPAESAELSLRASIRSRTAWTVCAGALIGASHFGLATDISVLCIVAIAFSQYRQLPVLENPALSMARLQSIRAHDQVLEAALKLFSQRGIDSTSMDAIAEASGVSKATIYKHWADKDALCLEVLARLHGIHEPPSFNSGDVRADIVALLSHRPSDKKSESQMRMMPHLMAYAARNPVSGVAWRKLVMEPPRNQLAQLLERAIAGGNSQPISI